jgi:hypothetical protein
VTRLNSHHVRAAAGHFIEQESLADSNFETSFSAKIVFLFQNRQIGSAERAITLINPGGADHQR